MAPNRGVRASIAIWGIRETRARPKRAVGFQVLREIRHCLLLHEEGGPYDQTFE
jgi:hypothetical protein